MVVIKNMINDQGKQIPNTNKKTNSLASTCIRDEASQHRTQEKKVLVSRNKKNLFKPNKPTKTPTHPKN
jgi:hypothetical protein